MSQELLIVTERPQYKRKISRSSHNINYLEVPCSGYMPLFNNRDSGYSDSSSGRQRSSSMTTSPVKLPNSHKTRRRRSLSPRLTGKSNSNILETIQRRSSVNSIATQASNRQLQAKPVGAKRINILIIGGENAGKACLSEYLNGSSISSSSSSDDWGKLGSLSTQELNDLIHGKPFHQYDVLGMREVFHSFGSYVKGSSASSSPRPHDVNIRVHNDPNGLSHVYKYDLVLLIYSVTDMATFKYIRNVINVTMNLNQKPVILIGNKIDLVRARVVSTSDGHRLATDHNLKFIETSALLNLNLNELLSGIKAQVSLQSGKKKVNLFEKIAGLLSHGRMSRSCLDLHTL